MSALTLAPVSPKAAELLHALYTEALATAEASLQVPPPGAIVLREPPTSGLRGHYRDGGGYRQLRLRTASWDYEISLQTSMLGNPEYPPHRPGIWYGSEERLDMQGRCWKGSLPCCYTTDDFGDLVEVPR